MSNSSLSDDYYDKLNDDKFGALLNRKIRFRCRYSLKISMEKFDLEEEYTLKDNEREENFCILLLNLTITNNNFYQNKTFETN